MVYKLGRRSLRNLVGVHPILAFAIHQAIKRSKVDFGVVEGVRSMERQKKLVKQGRSKTFNSYHLYGLAADLVPYIDGNYRWDSIEAFNKIYDAMSSVIKEYNLPIQNGYKLWGWDRPHWQMTGWRKKYDIRKIDPVRFPG